jgi:hypothetical protein
MLATAVLKAAYVERIEQTLAEARDCVCVYSCGAACVCVR